MNIESGETWSLSYVNYGLLLKKYQSMKDIGSFLSVKDRTQQNVTNQFTNALKSPCFYNVFYFFFCFFDFFRSFAIKVSMF